MSSLKQQFDSRLGKAIGEFEDGKSLSGDIPALLISERRATIPLTHCISMSISTGLTTATPLRTTAITASSTTER